MFTEETKIEVSDNCRSDSGNVSRQNQTSNNTFIYAIFVIITLDTWEDGRGRTWEEQDAESQHRRVLSDWHE